MFTYFVAILSLEVAIIVFVIVILTMIPLLCTAKLFFIVSTVTEFYYFSL